MVTVSQAVVSSGQIFETMILTRLHAESIPACHGLIVVYVHVHDIDTVSMLLLLIMPGC